MTNRKRASTPRTPRAASSSSGGRRSTGRRTSAARPGNRPAPVSEGGSQRLQKILAAAGIASRRECEQLILEGRVEVDRQVVTVLGTCVDPMEQEIRVDGVALRRPKRTYFMVNKPAGVVCTNDDPSGRTRVIDLVKSDERLFTVGRLDRTSEGLIIVTNDGELANQLTHPRYGVEKTYAVCVAGKPTHDELNKLRKGIHLAEATVRVASLEVKRHHKQSTDLEIVLNEGRNRELRRILARIGHKVLRLKRTALGTVRLGTLPVGAHRQLTSEEVRKLESCVHQPRRTPSPTGLGKPPARSAEKRGQPRPGPGSRPSRQAGPPARPAEKRGPPRSGPGSRPPQQAEPPQKKRPAGSILTYEAPDDGPADGPEEY